MTPILTFDSNFRIPPLNEQLELDVGKLTFKSMEFMYHLPNNLTCLRLNAIFQAKMSPFTEKIKWPLVLSSFTFKGFDIRSRTLELLNLKESNITKIQISNGYIQKLDSDLFPISVEDFTLEAMGIEELSESFEQLENLRSFSLSRNQLRKVTHVKLPISSLYYLDLCVCNLRLVSPFLVSMYEEKNKNAKLRIHASGNWNVSVIDVRRVMKTFKGLSLLLSKYDETLKEITKRSSRLNAIYWTTDPYVSRIGYSGPEEVISDYDSDDLYDGSVGNLDKEHEDEDEDEEEKDIFYYIDTMEDASSIETSDEDLVS